MKKRLFIAIRYNASEEIKELINEFSFELSDEKIKWTNVNSLHLTLKFLGDTKAELIPEIIDTLHQSANMFEPFDLHVSSFGAFYRGKFPSVLFLQLSKSDELVSLAGSVSVGMQELGFPKENRRFKGHITLGRIKFLKDIERFHELLEISCYDQFTVDSFVLIESRLTRSGPIYKTIEQFTNS